MDKTFQKQQLASAPLEAVFFIYTVQLNPKDPLHEIQTTACYTTSRRCQQKNGTIIQDSPQALTFAKYDWIEAAQPENTGTPNSMLTMVARCHSSNNQTHVQRGPCVPPNPEDTFLLLMGRKGKEYKMREHIGLQTADYLQRRHAFTHNSYAFNRDTNRGRIAQWTRRTEGQKRGPQHDHICDFIASCGLLFHAPSKKEKCNHVSRFCTKLKRQCTLPDHCMHSKRHQLIHAAPVSAEMCRPYLLGSVSHGPPLPESSPSLWSDTSETAFTVTIPPGFRRRVSDAASTHPVIIEQKKNKGSTDSVDFTKLSFQAPMLLEDLIAGYYYRSVQTHTSVVHSCKLGYCRHSPASPCKRGFPFTNLLQQEKFDEASERLHLVRRNLLDDAYVRGHTLYSILSTLMDVLIQTFSPEDAAPALAYQPKYQCKLEPQVALQQKQEDGHPASDLFKTQLKALNSIMAEIMNNNILESSFANPILALPCWKLDDTSQQN